jgi:CBS domain-containing protein
VARIADVMSLRLVTVRPEETVQVAIARMLEENVGGVVVCNGDRLAGIFTERDVLRLVGGGDHFAELRVADVMTREVITVGPDDEVVEAARLMGERQVRHLPVVQDGNVLGLVGIREALRSLLEILWRDHDPAARATARELLRRG